MEKLENINIRTTSIIPPSSHPNDAESHRLSYNNSPVSALSSTLSHVHLSQTSESSPSSPGPLRRCLFASQSLTPPPPPIRPLEAPHVHPQYRLTRSCTDLDLARTLRGDSNVNLSPDPTPLGPVDEEDEGEAPVVAAVPVNMRPFRSTSSLAVATRPRRVDSDPAGFHQPLVLPTIKGTHADLNCITSDTVRRWEV